MKNKSIFILLIGAVFSLFALLSTAGEGVNPFNPIFTKSSAIAQDAYSDNGELSEGAHPLQQQSVKNYTLMAVITSKNGKIAMVRAKNGEEYFVRIDDLLGNAEGKITSINARGIEVSEKDQVVSLLVRNRSVINEKAK
jgi:type IV pilus assembly protein PilP